MRTVAQRFGISDVGLAKNCRVMKIPVPGRGYWAKKAVGKPVRQIPLPTLPPNATATRQDIEFRPAPAAPPPSPVSDAVAAQRAFEADPANEIVVLQTLRAPHALVKKTIEVFANEARPDTSGGRYKREPRLAIEVSKQQRQRALRIADALLRHVRAA